MANNGDVHVDFDAQLDPIMLLLKNVIITDNGENSLQGQVANVLQGWSQGATDNINAGDVQLSAYANAVQHATTAHGGMTIAQAKYSKVQTETSLVNNQCSQLMQGGSTSLTNLTDDQSQILQLASGVVENMQFITGLIQNGSIV